MQSINEGKNLGIQLMETKNSQKKILNLNQKN